MKATVIKTMKQKDQNAETLLGMKRLLPALTSAIDDMICGSDENNVPTIEDMANMDFQLQQMVGLFEQLKANNQ